MSHSFDKHGLKVQSSASRLADRLLPQLAGWIDCDDIAQEIHLAELENPQTQYGKSVQSVDRGLRALGIRIGEPDKINPDTRLRPTETAVIRRMFWRSLLDVLRMPANKLNVPENPLRKMRIFAQRYIGGYTLEEIGDIDGTTGKRVEYIIDKTKRQLRHPSRLPMLKEYTEEDLSR